MPPAMLLTGGTLPAPISLIRIEVNWTHRSEVLSSGFLASR